jgi:peptidoglycan/LPS O-acetylase OafA/YrhL
VSFELQVSRRIPTLDGWRAIAILGVLCAHIRWPLPQLQIPGIGDFGVRLFFALSGFLITSRLLDENDARGAVSWRNFYIRRAFRILPPAFVALFVLALLGPALHTLPIGAREIIASAFFYRNYAHVSGWYTGHFWSLAVEEHFYLVWPAVLCFVGIARAWRAAVLLAGIFTLWRHADMHFNWIAHLQPWLFGNSHRTDYRISSLLWGCVLAFLWRNQAAQRLLRKVVRSWWALPLVAVAVTADRFQNRWSGDELDLAIAVLPLVTIADPRGIISRVLETRILRWIGRLSYSLYLWQELFMPYYSEPKGLVQQFPFNVVAAFSVATLSYYFVELPFISFGRRLVKAGGSPSRAMVGISAALSAPSEQASLRADTQAQHFGQS